MCSLSGVCVEALCSPTSIQPIDTVVLCLKAIYTLLDDPWPRSRIGTDQSLAIELLNVLHRSVSSIPQQATEKGILSLNSLLITILLENVACYLILLYLLVILYRDCEIFYFYKIVRISNKSTKSKCQ